MIRDSEIVRVFPYGDYHRVWEGRVVTVSANQQVIVFGFQQKPPFSTQMILPETSEFLLMATRAEASGLWFEIFSRRPFEIEERK